MPPRLVIIVLCVFVVLKFVLVVEIEVFRVIVIVHIIVIIPGLRFLLRLVWNIRLGGIFATLVPDLNNFAFDASCAEDSVPVYPEIIEICFISCGESEA